MDFTSYCGKHTSRKSDHLWHFRNRWCPATNCNHWMQQFNICYTTLGAWVDPKLEGTVSSGYCEEGFTRGSLDTRVYTNMEFDVQGFFSSRDSTPRSRWASDFLLEADVNITLTLLSWILIKIVCWMRKNGYPAPNSAVHIIYPTFHRFYVAAIIVLSKSGIQILPTFLLPYLRVHRCADESLNANSGVFPTGSWNALRHQRWTTARWTYPLLCFSVLERLVAVL